MSKRRQIPSLRRKQPTREPRTRFVIFCEGENTETAYFSALRKVFADTLIDIETRPGVGVPYTIAVKAIEYAIKSGIGESSRSKNSFADNDEVWVVFDRDEHPRFHEALQLCERNKIGLGVSNPCFELWLILHFEDFDKPSDRHDVQRRLQELDPKYDRQKSKCPDCGRIISACDTARVRAERQLMRRKEEKVEPINPPYTTVFKLIERMGAVSTRNTRRTPIAG